MVAGKGWIEVRYLAAGQYVEGLSDTALLVTSVVLADGPRSTYNFEVARSHTYFVGAGGAWVHNTGPCNDLGKNVVTDAPDGPFSWVNDKRITSNAKLKKEWEKLTGQPWPKDPRTGRNQDVPHKVPLADGGPDHVSNIEPVPSDVHNQNHRDANDFSRWRRRR